MELSDLQRSDVSFLTLFRTVQNGGKLALEDVRPDQFPSKNGGVIISCADGDQDMDLRTRHWSYCEGGRPCHHNLALNGGPLLIPALSPIAKHGEGKAFLEHALGGLKLKKVDAVHLYAHWPCGMAGLNDLSLVDCLILLRNAKLEIRSFLQESGQQATVVPLMHVQHVHQDGRRRTYYFDRHVFGNVLQMHCSQQNGRWVLRCEATERSAA